MTCDRHAEASVSLSLPQQSSFVDFLQPKMNLNFPLSSAPHFFFFNHRKQNESKTEWEQKKEKDI